MFLFKPILTLRIETSIIHYINISFRQKFYGTIISKEAIRKMYKYLRSVNAKHTMNNRDFSIVNFKDDKVTNIKRLRFVISKE